MAKDIFQFACPCCGKSIEVNTRSGKARAVKPQEAKGKDLDSLINQHKGESDRLRSKFDEAKNDQASLPSRFDELLSDAARRAKEDGDSKPRNPFDLE